MVVVGMGWLVVVGLVGCGVCPLLHRWHKVLATPMVIRSWWDQ